VPAAHRLELDDATDSILASLIRGKVPPVEEERDLVSATNALSPGDADVRKLEIMLCMDFFSHFEEL
jgi:hypothetical protein